MVTVTLPDCWILVAPCGCIDGIRHSVLNGTVITATADEAWASFTRLKRDRDREKRDGYTLRGGTLDDWEAARSTCPHVPQWTAPQGGE